MNTFLWVLPEVTENFISVMPKVLIFFYYGLDCFQSSDRGVLVLRLDSTAVKQCLKGLMVFSLKHHLDLAPSFLD